MTWPKRPLEPVPVPEPDYSYIEVDANGKEWVVKHYPQVYDSQEVRTRSIISQDSLMKKAATGGIGARTNDFV